MNVHSIQPCADPEATALAIAHLISAHFEDEAGVVTPVEAEKRATHIHKLATLILGREPVAEPAAAGRRGGVGLRSQPQDDTGNGDGKAPVARKGRGKK